MFFYFIYKKEILIYFFIFFLFISLDSVLVNDGWVIFSFCVIFCWLWIIECVFRYFNKWVFKFNKVNLFNFLFKKIFLFEIFFKKFCIINGCKCINFKNFFLFIIKIL